MKMHFLSAAAVVVALVAGISLAVPLTLWSSSSSRQPAHRDRLGALKRHQILQTLLRNIVDDDIDWTRTRRSQPSEWLGTQAAGTAWDAYVRMLRQQQLDQPRRTVNPVNFLGKRATFFK